jgi:hypothetical protein
MQAYWLSFARDGKPSPAAGTTDPQWPAASKSAPSNMDSITFQHWGPDAIVGMPFDREEQIAFWTKATSHLKSPSIPGRSVAPTPQLSSPLSSMAPDRFLTAAPTMPYLVIPIPVAPASSSTLSTGVAFSIAAALVLMHGAILF